MKGSHREEPFEGVVQFGENPACRLESTRFRVWDFSEIPYLNKSLKKPSKPKLDAILRSFSCPAYPAVPRWLNRFCNLHYAMNELGRHTLTDGKITLLVQVGADGEKR
jgi:hypothetical protein